MLQLRRDGQIHLSGLRTLAPHLSRDNQEVLFGEAIGKTRQQIDEIVASHFPKPAVPDSMRKVPSRPEPGSPLLSAPPAPPAEAPASSTGPATPSSERAPIATTESPVGDFPGSPLVLRPPPSGRGTVAPLSADRFEVRFTADRELRDKIEEARALLRHQIPDGSLAAVIDRAMTLLVREVKKQRFGVGRKPRRPKAPSAEKKPEAASRHVPDATKREVYERDGGQCTFVDARGRRCPERGWLQIDHVAGFARDPARSPESCRLLCAGHNGHAADMLYGKDFMDGKRPKKPGGGPEPRGPEPTR
jgi:5-methylcytosine-specific restriction endonuclease McrA